jgi:hypothetical protein
MNAAPSSRPTEWTAALVGIVGAVILWQTNHDTAALVSTVGAVLPGLVTLIVEYLHKAPTPTA